MMSLPSRAITLALAWLTLAAPARPASAPAPAPEEASGWLPILRQQANEYEIVPRGGDGRPLRPHPEPLLRWTQPVRGGDDGAVFLWTRDGRPEAVGTFFTWKAEGPRVVTHEFHSLAPTGLDATWRGKPAWHPAGPGLDFRPVPEAPEPSASAPARLRQMQAIARDCAASSVHERNGRNELRLMPRALFRYEAPDPVLRDGALFCFAAGTDPELFVLVEARRDGRNLAYHFAFARFSDLELRVSYRGKATWTVPLTRTNARDRAYACFSAEVVEAETPQDYLRLQKER